MVDTYERSDKDNLRRDDRILVLKPIDDKASISSTGVLDRNLFTGGNNLHVKMDPETTMWSFYYDHGKLPPQLKQKFTSFSRACEYAKAYLKRRNTDIIEIKD
jgi:hypothetical protein